MNKLQFGDNLKYLRELDGLIQAQMLTTIGFKQSTWNGYETGKSVPSFNDLIKISHYYGVLESDLIHTKLDGNNLRTMREKYILASDFIENLASTPLSKSFYQFLNEVKSTLPHPISKGKISPTLSPTLSPTPEKRYKSPSEDTHAMAMEPESIYRQHTCYKDEIIKEKDKTIGDLQTALSSVSSALQVNTPKVKHA